MTFHSSLTNFLKSFPPAYGGNDFYTVWDTETTGFSIKYADLISLSVEVRDFNNDLKDEITLYAKPTEKRWSKQAEAIHQITLDEALTFPEPRESAIRLLHFLKPFKHEGNIPMLFVSHDNNGFDYRWMENLFIITDLINSWRKVFNSDYKISTIKMAKKHQYVENRLNVWADRLKFELNHHEVCSDRKGCSKVFQYLIETYYGMETSSEEGSKQQKTLQML